MATRGLNVVLMSPASRTQGTEANWFSSRAVAIATYVGTGVGIVGLAVALIVTGYIRQGVRRHWNNGWPQAQVVAVGCGLLLLLAVAIACRRGRSMRHQYEKATGQLRRQGEESSLRYETVVTDLRAQLGGCIMERES